MRFEFMTAGRIVVGHGCSSELDGLAVSLGRRALLVTGHTLLARGGPAAALAQQLERSGRVVRTVRIGREPDVATAEAGAQAAQEAACDCVIGLGGGSVLDAAKAIAGLAVNPGGALEYLEVVGKARPLQNQALPLIAVPTTAGTGSEVTRNAVLTCPDHQVKASIRHASLLPQVALIDSALTADMPASVTASSGSDALTQLMEPYVSRRAQPLTDALCLDGLRRIRGALQRAYHHGQDLEAREQMSLASLLSGMTLANAGLGAIHGIAAPLGGKWNVPHGAACAALMASVTAQNLHALRRHPELCDVQERYAEVARVLLGRAGLTQAGLLDDLERHLTALAEELQIQRLGTLGVQPADVPGLAAQAMRASSTRGNPVELSHAELEEAILRAL